MFGHSDEEVQQKIDEIEAELVQQAEQINEMRQERGLLRLKDDAMRKERLAVAVLKHRVTAQQHRLEDLRGREPIPIIRPQIDSAADDKLWPEVRELEGEIARVTDKVHRGEALMRRIDRRQDAAAARMEGLRADKAGVAERVEALEAKIAEFPALLQSARSKLAQQVAELDAAIQSLVEEKRSLDQRITAVEKDSWQTTQANQKAAARRGELSARRDLLIREISASTSRASSFGGVMASPEGCNERSLLSSGPEEEDDLELDGAGLLARREALAAEVREVDAQVAGLQAQIADLSRMVEADNSVFGAVLGVLDGVEDVCRTGRIEGTGPK